MSSKIGNEGKILMRERAARLGIIDPKLGAADLATDRIIPVQEVDPRYLGPQIGVETVDYNSGIRSIAGLTQDDWEIMPAAAANLNTRVNAIHLRVDVPSDAAPSEVQFFIYYQLPVGQPFRIVDYKPAFSTVNSALTQYRYAMGGSFLVVSGTAAGWHGHVPPLVPLRMSIIKSSGGTFPAGSSLTWSRFVSQWPVGTLPPWG